MSDKVNLLVIQHVSDMNNLTRIVTTVIDRDTLEVIARRQADFDQVPLAPLARNYREFTERVLRLQLKIGHLTFHCNIHGPRPVLKGRDRIEWVWKCKDPETGESFDLDKSEIEASAVNGERKAVS
ncbi:MAG TPA: hypothetical protein VFK33_10855 [Bacillales bacterium]|nr:hypothetical protein [Bacillales bacterium]